MGCTTSKLDRLPAVSLCYQRCRFLNEALHQTYSLFDAHLAYLHSLNSLGPILRNFLDRNDTVRSVSFSQTTHNTATTVTEDPSKSSSSKDSESAASHNDLDSDSSEEEFIREGSFDLLHSINPNCFHYQAVNSRQYDSSYFEPSNPESSWKTPSPPAPSSSTWDFLNFFESYERYDVLKMDKEVTSDVKTDKSGKNREKLTEEKVNKSGEKVVKEESNVKKEEKGDSAKMEETEKNESKVRSVAEIMREVEVMFEKASDSGIEVLKLLDTGKFHQHYNNTSGYGEDFEDLSMNSGNLFSTIKKLCIWEKKLYDEVKAEEKLRIVRARYCRQMKSLAEKGVKTNKVDSTKALIRTISTKINVSIQVIDRISRSISKLRDEELWPQIIELIQKYFEMWKAMTECHQCQSEAVLEARNLDAITSIINHDDAHLESAMQLKIELQKWNLSFCCWIDSQRFYVKALNNWLQKCLPQEPEAKPDGLPPPLFALCDQWSHAMNSISEMEVVENINGLLMNLNQMMERELMSAQQKVTSDKDAEKKMKILEREDQKLQKLLLARGKKAFLSSKDSDGFFLPARSVQGSNRPSTSSLHLCLKQIFIAIDRFSIDNMKAYQKLNLHVEEEDRHPKENAEKVLNSS